MHLLLEFPCVLCETGQIPNFDTATHSYWGENQGDQNHKDKDKFRFCKKDGKMKIKPIIIKIIRDGNKIQQKSSWLS